MNLQNNFILCLLFSFYSVYFLFGLITYLYHKTLLVHGTILAIYNFIVWTFLLWIVSYLVLSRFGLDVVLRLEYVYHSYGMIVLLTTILLVLFLFCFQKGKKTWEFLWFEGNIFDSFRKILDAHNLPYIENWKNNNERTKNVFLTNFRESITITFYKGTSSVTIVHKKGIHEKLFNELYEKLKEKSSFPSHPLKIKIIVALAVLTILSATTALIIGCCL